MTLLPDLTQEPGDPSPRVLHMIWLGGTYPNWLKESVRRWVEALPSGWAVNLWTDEKVRSHLHLLQVQSTAKLSGLSVRAQADLLRIAITHRWGGVYVDTDTVPVDVSFLEREGSWIGGKPESEDRTLINAHFRMEPGEPFLRILWEEAEKAILRNIKNDHYVAGPRTWRKAYGLAENPPPIIPAFPTIEKGPIPRLFALGDMPSQETLQLQFPDTALLHVIYSRSHAL